MQKKSKSLFLGAVILSFGQVVAKILGAVYRIPLTNILKSTGIGLYQMVFPVYVILLEFSGVGAPNAFAKIIAERGDEYSAFSFLNSGRRLFAIVGAIFSVFMLVFAYPISLLQGNKDAFYSYLFLAPSVLLVSLISCYRGYFQGLLKMKPTAFSQIAEQTVKLVFGLVFAYLLSFNIKFSVAGAVFAVTISEGFALIYLHLEYKKRAKANKLFFVYKKSQYQEDVKRIIKYVVPVTLVGIAIPFSQIIDSFLVVNILNSYREDATALYGIFSGACQSVVNLPISVCYGIAVVAIPKISAEKTKTDTAAKSIFLTLLVSLPSAFIVYNFSPQIISLLFKTFSESENAVAVNLLKYLSINIVLLSVLQTENSILIAKGKPYLPLVGMISGVVIKTALSVLLLSNPEFNIYGVAIGLISCYFVGVVINFILILGKGVKYESKSNINREYAN